MNTFLNAWQRFMKQISQHINFDGIIAATFFTNLFYSMSYPYIHKTILSYASASLISINQIVNCLSIILFSSLWNKYGEKLYKYYQLICIVETIATISTSIFVILTNNIVAYYILDTLVFALITRNICCGGIKLRAQKYNSEEKRVLADNNINSAASLATIIGSICAIYMNYSFPIMIVLSTIGNTIDNIFYIFIYRSINKKK